MNKLWTPQHPFPGPKGLVPIHHSVSDWNIYPANTVYTLDTTEYISSPKSLKITVGPGPGHHHYFTCRVAATLNLPQGRCRTQMRLDGTYATQAPFYFRIQRPIGVSSPYKAYYIAFTTTKWQLWTFIDGVDTMIDERDLVSASVNWYNRQVTWWNSITPLSEDALAVIVEQEVGGVFVEQGEWIYDTDNLFKDSTQNRVAVTAEVTTGHSAWFDDTYIWGPA